MRPDLQRRMTKAALVYLPVYALASYLDLWTTHLALATSGTHEANAFLTTGRAYLSTRSWILTIGAGVLMIAGVVFAAAYAERMDGKWLSQPISSFNKFYLNPWSRSAMTVSPLHALSLAIGFALLRILAAGNNTLIYFYGIAPIGGLVDRVARRTSGIVGFVIVLLPLFYLLAMAVSPIAARIIAAWRSPIANAVGV